MTDPLTLCWCCDRLLGVGGDAGERPGVGDVAVCGWCGAIAVVGADLRTVPPGEDTLWVLASNPAWRAMYVAKLREVADIRRAENRYR